MDTAISVLTMCLVFVAIVVGLSITLLVLMHYTDVDDPFRSVFHRRADR